MEKPEITGNGRNLRLIKLGNVIVDCTENGNIKNYRTRSTRRDKKSNQNRWRDDWLYDDDPNSNISEELRDFYVDSICSNISAKNNSNENCPIEGNILGTNFMPQNKVECDQSNADLQEFIALNETLSNSKTNVSFESNHSSGNSLESNAVNSNSFENNNNEIPFLDNRSAYINQFGITSDNYFPIGMNL